MILHKYQLWRKSLALFWFGEFNRPTVQLCFQWYCDRARQIIRPSLSYVVMKYVRVLGHPCHIIISIVAVSVTMMIIFLFCSNYCRLTDMHLRMLNKLKSDGNVVMCSVTPQGKCLFQTWEKCETPLALPHNPLQMVTIMTAWATACEPPRFMGSWWRTKQCENPHAWMLCPRWGLWGRRGRKNEGVLTPFDAPWSRCFVQWLVCTGVGLTLVLTTYCTFCS